MNIFDLNQLRNQQDPRWFARFLRGLAALRYCSPLEVDQLFHDLKKEVERSGSLLGLEPWLLAVFHTELRNGRVEVIRPAKELLEKSQRAPIEVGDLFDPGRDSLSLDLDAWKDLGPSGLSSDRLGELTSGGVFELGHFGGGLLDDGSGGPGPGVLRDTGTGRVSSDVRSAAGVGVTAGVVAGLGSGALLAGLGPLGGAIAVGIGLVTAIIAFFVSLFSSDTPPDRFLPATQQPADKPRDTTPDPDNDKAGRTIALSPSQLARIGQVVREIAGGIGPSDHADDGIAVKPSAAIIRRIIMIDNGDIDWGPDGRLGLGKAPAGSAEFEISTPVSDSPDKDDEVVIDVTIKGRGPRPHSMPGFRINYGTRSVFLAKGPDGALVPVGG